MFIKKKVFGGIDFDPLTMYRGHSDSLLTREQQGKKTGHIQFVPTEGIQGFEGCFDVVPAARGDAQQSHVLCFDIFVGAGAAADAAKCPIVVKEERFSVVQRVIESSIP